MRIRSTTQRKYLSMVKWRKYHSPYHVYSNSRVNGRFNVKFMKVYTLLKYVDNDLAH